MLGLSAGITATKPDLEVARQILWACCLCRKPTFSEDQSPGQLGLQGLSSCWYQKTPVLGAALLAWHFCSGKDSAGHQTPCTPLLPFLHSLTVIVFAIIPLSYASSSLQFHNVSLRPFRGMISYSLGSSFEYHTETARIFPDLYFKGLTGVLLA